MKKERFFIVTISVNDKLGIIPVINETYPNKLKLTDRISKNLEIDKKNISIVFINELSVEDFKSFTNND